MKTAVAPLELTRLMAHPSNRKRPSSLRNFRQLCGKHHRTHLGFCRDGGCCSCGLLFCLLAAIISLSHFVILSLLFVLKGSGLLRSQLPTSLFEHAHRWARLQPTRTGDHTLCDRALHAHFGRVTTACVSSPKRLGCLHCTQQNGASTSGRSVRSV